MKYIPTIITASNVLLGILALFLIVTGNPEWVLFIIPVAAFFDFADGWLARRLNAETKIGCILDSASDLICFVFVPSFYVFGVHKETLSIFLISGCVVYLLAGIKRLARYTLTKLKTNSQNGFFIGCPVTAAALCVVMVTGIYESAAFHILLLFVCSYFMISKIEYSSFSTIINRYSREAFFFIYLFLILPFFLIYPLRVIFTVSCMYLLFFPIYQVWAHKGHPSWRLSLRIFPFAEGLRRIIVVCTAFLLMSFLFLPVWLRVFYLIILFAVAFFSRDPGRTPRESDKFNILAPTDGQVLSIKKEFNEKTGEFFNKVSMFLSLFDVHVNRAPANVRILECIHHDGGHLDARHPQAGANEYNLFTFKLESGKIILLKQIAGRFARRVLSYVKEGDVLKKGERLGVILFGSRVELFLPPEIELLVKAGDVVKAAITPIAVIGPRNEPI